MQKSRARRSKFTHRYWLPRIATSNTSLGRRAGGDDKGTFSLVPLTGLLCFLGLFSFLSFFFSTELGNCLGMGLEFLGHIGARGGSCWDSPPMFGQIPQRFDLNFHSTCNNSCISGWSSELASLQPFPVPLHVLTTCLVSVVSAFGHPQPCFSFCPFFFYDRD